MSVAIFGLSADPPHKGHLKVAEALQEMGYERVVWMLTPQNPLKHAIPTPYWHRMELARALIGRRTWLELSDAEAWMQLYGDELRTHTMLGQLKKIYPETDFTFVIGADNWMHFHNWGRYKELLDYVALLIVPRLGSGRLDNVPAALTLANQRDKATSGIVTQGKWRILVDAPGGNASSKHLRQDLAAGEDTSKWLNAEQLAYIQDHGLYGVSKKKRR